MALSEHQKGLIITVGGILVLTPDALLIRLVGADAWTIAFWRGVLVGCAILIGSFCVDRKGLFATLRTFGKADAAYAIFHGIGSAAFVASITLTTVANSLFILSTSPLWAAIISWIFLGERVGARTWLAITVAAAGIGLIASGSFGEGGGNPIGDLAALVNALMMACAFTLARATKERSMVPAMGFSGFLSALFVLPLVGAVSVSFEGAAWLGLMGLIVVPFAFSMLTLGPRYLPSPEVSLIFLLEAVIAPFWVWLVLAEYPGDRTLIGGGIVLATLTVHILLTARGKTASTG